MCIRLEKTGPNPWDVATTGNRTAADDMSETLPRWFVRTDLGALLGPMPSDALAEMARTGALLRRDEVREETHATWRPAGEFPGLFDDAAFPLGSVAPTFNEQTLTSPSEDALIAPSEPDSAEAASLEDLLGVCSGDSWRVTTTGKTPSPREDPREVGFGVDASVVTPPATDTLIATGQPVTEEPASLMSEVLVKPHELARSRETIQAAQAMEPVRRRVMPARPTTRWASAAAQKRRVPAGSRTWGRVAIGLASMFALLSLWWLWPRQRPDLGARFVAIYREWEHRKPSSDDDAGWSEFVARASTELDRAVTWLEPRAKPGDREKTLLLYTARDLLELIQQPRENAFPQQQRLKTFLDELQKLYGLPNDAP